MNAYITQLEKQLTIVQAESTRLLEENRRLEALLRAQEEATALMQKRLGETVTAMNQGRREVFEI